MVNGNSMEWEMIIDMEEGDTDRESYDVTIMLYHLDQEFADLL